MTRRKPKIIDVRKSELDAEASKRKGIPVFSKKAYYKFRDNTGLSPWWFYWGPKEDGTELSRLQNAENYEFVTKDDPYIPEGVKLNPEKRYQNGDHVLMKCPLQEYIQRRIAARTIAEARVKSRANQFRAEIEKDGGLNLTDEQLHDILGSD